MIKADKKWILIMIVVGILIFTQIGKKEIIPWTQCDGYCTSNTAVLINNEIICEQDYGVSCTIVGECLVCNGGGEQLPCPTNEWEGINCPTEARCEDLLVDRNSANPIYDCDTFDILDCGRRANDDECTLGVNCNPPCPDPSTANCGDYIAPYSGCYGPCPAGTQCPSGQTCFDGQCSIYCSDECTSGQIRCNPTYTNYKQTCGDYDSDSCLEWGDDYYCEHGCLNGVCIQEGFQVLQATASKVGNSIKATYQIKNLGSSYTSFIIESQADFQSKKAAQIGLQSVCNINCPYNVHRSVGLSAGETATIEMYIPLQGGSMPNGEYFIKAVSANKCFGDTSIGPFPDQPIIAENIVINSGIPSPIDLCTPIYCGDNECNGDETYQTCPQDCSIDCDTSCTGWTGGSCGVGVCLLNERQYTRTCTTGGCSVSYCDYDPTCGQVCSPLTEGDTKDCVVDGCPGTNTCHNSQWGNCVKDDPTCGVCDESTCGEWSDCINNIQSRTCTDSDCVETDISKSCVIPDNGVAPPKECKTDADCVASDCEECYNGQCASKCTLIQECKDGECKTSMLVWIVGLAFLAIIAFKTLGGKKK